MKFEFCASFDADTICKQKAQKKTRYPDILRVFFANSLPGGPPFTGDTLDAMYVYASDLYVPYIDCVAPYKYCVALKSKLFGPGKSRDHVSQ